VDVSSQAVPWRRVAAVLVAAALALGGAFIAFRSEGFRSIDAAVPRATRWFVDQNSKALVLADGFSGRALFRLSSTIEAVIPEVAQSASGVAIVDRDEATTREVDTTTLRLGAAQRVPLLNETDSVVGIGTTGLVVVEPDGGDALLLPPGGAPVPFSVTAGADRDQTRIAPDGAVWTLVDGSLHRENTTSSPRIVTGLSAEARFSLVGNVPLVFDTGAGRASLNGGSWVELPGDISVSEVVLQADGPAESCGWIGAQNRLWCINESGIEHEVVIPGVDIDGGDQLAIAGDAAALVSNSGSDVIRLDWRNRQIVTGSGGPQPRADADLAVTASTDLIWVEDRNSADVWAINPWGVQAIKKDDETAPLLGEGGEVIEEGGDLPASGAGLDQGDSGRPDIPDDNGIDDPPVALDDPVTARTGGQVRVEVTANDYDPDGEAIVVVDAMPPGNGTVEITSASTVTYRPDTGYVGIDTFDYTISDANGNEATATVTLELLSQDAPNRGPIGARDFSETGPGVPVVVDVLLNDVDPERDALRIDSFTDPSIGGSVTEVDAPSGLRGLRYEPPAGVDGTATFTYVPIDSLGALGEPTEVVVEIASASEQNRPPIVLPDALLVRRDQEKRLPVLANDRDPDGDRLQLALAGPQPPGIEATVDGNEIVIVARAAAERLNSFAYEVDDGHGHTVDGWVLVALIGDEAPNSPPVAVPDAETAVVGETQLIDVLANDTDPDGDTPILIAVRREGEGGSVRVRGDEIEYIAAPLDSGDEQRLDRFEYTITDGKGGEDIGEVTVRVLPERIADPPYAQDDAATTTRNTAVTLDVLRNDGDPSGEQPTLLGDPGCAQGGTAEVTDDDRVTFTPPRDEIGIFTCTYRLTNSQGGQAGATITINVIPEPVTNQAPVVRNGNGTVEVGGTLRSNLLDLAIDPDGDELTLLTPDRPNVGTLRSSSNGQITYVAGTIPEPVTISFRVQDSEGNVSARANFVIDVVPADDQPPSAAPDSRSTTTAAPVVSIAVLANDDDPDGDRSDLRVIGVDLLSGDAIVGHDDTTVTIRAAAGFVGTVEVRYTIADADGLTDSSKVTLVVVEAPNSPPVAGNDADEVVSGGRVTVPVGLNDSDPDGDPLTWRIVSNAESRLGSASLDGPNLTFRASPGASGVATIVYEVDDGEETAEATVSITILACAQGPPNAPDRRFTTGYQTPIAIDLTTDISNGEIVAVDPPLNAPVGVYTPPAGENGNVVFRYTVENACRVQDTGTVTIDVNQDPESKGTHRLSVGRRATGQILVSDLATDDEPLRITALSGNPAWVSVSGDQRSIAINPAGNTGIFNMTAVIADPGGLTTSVQIELTVANFPPVAGNDRVTSPGGPVTFDPKQNDSDPDGDPTTLSVPATFTFPSGIVGTIDREPGTDRLRLDPKGGSGVATFTYTLVDDLGLTSSPATVTFTVNGAPSTPSQTNVTIRAGRTGSVTVSASDPDGDPLALTVLGDPSPLGVQVNGFVVEISVPAGTGGNQYEIAYRVSDPQGAFDDGVIVVTAGTPPTTTTTTLPPTTTTTTTTLPPVTTTIPSSSTVPTTTLPPGDGG
jgi:hypothetical protein